MNGTILLFYKYVTIDTPSEVVRWQRDLCTALNLKGRIIIAQEGINATLGGTDENVQAYITAMNNNPTFKDIDFKKSPGGADFFPRLRVVIKEEIVRMGISPQKLGVEHAGVHLTPAQTNELIEKSNKDLVILDGRNAYEAKIGTFRNAVVPSIDTFREFPAYVDENLDLFKDKDVLMFCTGGIRCERASAYLNTKGVAKKVYQIKGGIHRYIEEFPDGHFRGKNYVFDARIAMKANDDVVGSCEVCSAPCDEVTNCINAQCNKQFIGCVACLEKLRDTCSEECLKLVTDQAVRIRTKPKKMSLTQPASTTVQS